MLSREFGQTGIKLSSVTFGSMRLAPERMDLDSALELISHLYHCGVNTFHSSHEYPSDSFFCQVLKQFQQLNPSAELVHIAKLGVPHFDESGFKGDRLVALVEQRLRELNTERLDLVQWLVRHQPNDDQHRLPILQDCQAELQETWLQLQAAGKVGVLTSFPYSVPFAEAVLQTPACKGLVTYLNLLELAMAPLLDEMNQANQGYVAIRPLAGGLLTPEQLHLPEQPNPEQERLRKIAQVLNLEASNLIAKAIQFPLLHPTVASVMVSVSSLSHANAIIDAAAVAKVDLAEFQNTVEAISPIQLAAQG